MFGNCCYFEESIHFFIPDGMLQYMLITFVTLSLMLFLYYRFVPTFVYFYQYSFLTKVAMQRKYFPQLLKSVFRCFFMYIKIGIKKCEHYLNCFILNLFFISVCVLYGYSYHHPIWYSFCDLNNILKYLCVQTKNKD